MQTAICSACRQHQDSAATVTCKAQCISPLKNTLLDAFTFVLMQPDPRSFPVFN